MTYQYPDFKTSGTFLNEITSIENRFLQKLIDMGATVVCMNEFTVFGFKSLAMFKIIDDNTILLECISTPVEERRQGSANKLMQAFIECANETNTQINLFACNVTGNGFMMMQHMVISHGMKTKNKIPVGQLKSWYEKFGFKALARDSKRKGWGMTYQKKS